MKKFLKKGFNIGLVIILSISIILSNILKVSAKMLTVNEVSEGLKDSTIIKLFNSEDGAFSSKVNTDAKTLDLYVGEEVYLSLNYTDEYLEYDNKGTVITIDNYNETVGQSLMLTGVMETIFNLSGYTLEDLGWDTESEVEYDINYERHGLEIINEDYSLSGSSDGGSYTLSGDYFKYVKMSLDTSKIDNLFADYKSNADNNPESNPILDLIPTLEAREITSNSVTLYPSIDYTPTDPEETVNCYIYRSNEENGEYSKISDWAVNCLGEVGLKDEGLESNTTYYYKAVVQDGTKFSNPLKVTTAINQENTLTPDSNTNNSETEDINPNTGAFLDMTVIISALILVTITLYYIRKHRKFYNI